MNDFISRRSVRFFDPTHKIPRHILENILKDTRYAPSAFNLQHWYFLIIESPHHKHKLKTCVYGNRTQLETSSAMILIFGDMQKTTLKEKIYNQIFDSKTIKEAQKYKEKTFAVINDYYNSITPEQFKNELFLEGGIAAMQLMMVAKSYGYDTCPIGGFNHQIVNTVLNVSDRYLITFMLAIGKPDKDHILHPTSRLDFDEFVQWL